MLAHCTVRFKLALANGLTYGDELGSAIDIKFCAVANEASS